MKTGPKPKFNDAQVQEIIALTDSGMSQEKIALKLGVVKGTIFNVLTRAGYKSKTVRDPDRIRARRLKENKFISKIPCHAGHVGERYTRNGSCVACSTKRNSRSLLSESVDTTVKWWECLEAALRVTIKKQEE